VLQFGCTSCSVSDDGWSDNEFDEEEVRKGQQRNLHCVQKKKSIIPRKLKNDSVKIQKQS